LVGSRGSSVTVENGIGGPAVAKASAVAKAMADKSADRLGTPPHWRLGNGLACSRDTESGKR